jgi:hypothetical protein
MLLFNGRILQAELDSYLLAVFRLICANYLGEKMEKKILYIGGAIVAGGIAIVAIHKHLQTVAANDAAANQQQYQDLASVIAASPGTAPVSQPASSNGGNSGIDSGNNLFQSVLDGLIGTTGPGMAVGSTTDNATVVTGPGPLNTPFDPSNVSSSPKAVITGLPNHPHNLPSQIVPIDNQAIVDPGIGGGITGSPVVAPVTIGKLKVI